MIELKHVSKTYDSGANGGVDALKDVSLTIEDGDIYGIIGMSGAGKSTLVRCINLLERPTGGEIIVDGQRLDTMTPAQLRAARRDITMIFQRFNLLMQRTCLRNVCFPMEISGVKRADAEKRGRELLELVGLPDKADAYPAQLSGGQQQRVAIARAIVSQPKVLLLDEPLSNLDAKLRIDMRSEIKRLHHEMGTTIVYVTHDQVEALTMSTRIAIFFEGELEQVAAPMDLYQNPISLRVADFIGNPRINFVEGQAKRGEDGGLVVTSSLGRMSFTADCLTDELPAQSSFDVVLGIRPEKIGICSQNGDGAIAASVYATQPAGSETTIHLKMGDDSVVLAKEMGIRNYAVDQVVHVKIAPDKLNVFAKETGRLIKMAVPD